MASRACARSCESRHSVATASLGKIERVTVTGQKVSGIYRADKETFHTYAPAQYQTLANELDAQGILIRR
jgi:hypothetical protein